MFVITNCRVNETATGLDQFGKTPNENGNNELRQAQFAKRKKGYGVNFLDVQLDKGEAHYASLKAACETVRRACADKRHVLFSHTATTTTCGTS